MSFRDLLLYAAILVALALTMSVEVHRLHQQLAWLPVPMFTAAPTPGGNQ